MVKEECAEKAERACAGTSVNITTHGKRHLGATVGSVAFRDKFVSGKVKGWCEELELLSQVAQSHPHAAYVHWQASKWSFISRTIPGIGRLLEPLEQVIQEKFIPAITGCPPVSSMERSLLALPARMGGLGLTDPTSYAEHCFDASRRITAPIAAMIALQGSDPISSSAKVKTIKSKVRTEKRNN